MGTGDVSIVTTCAVSPARLAYMNGKVSVECSWPGLQDLFRGMEA